MPDDAPNLGTLWTKAIEVSSPKMLRGVVGCAFFTYGLAWIPNIPANDIDLWLQYGFFAADGVSALTLLLGIVTGR